jgi:hypothetical protein
MLDRSWSAKRLTMKKSGIILIVGLILLTGVLYVYKEYNRGNKVLSEVEPSIKISANDISVSFAQSDSLANLKFLGKVIEIEGVIKNIEMPDSNISVIVLAGNNEMSSIRCTMDSSFHNTSNQNETGTSATLKGICTGYNADDLLGSDVLLNRCVIVK